MDNASSLTRKATIAQIRTQIHSADALFPDAFYDIGKSGATRPRNIFASGTITAGGAGTFASLALSGAITGATTGAFSGAVTIGGTLAVTGSALFSTGSFSSGIGLDGLGTSGGVALLLPASTAARSPLRINHGVTPTTFLTDGDMWTTTAGLFIRINGVTKTVTLT